MKKLTAMLLCLAMVLVMLSGCNVKTKDDVKGPDTSSNDNSASTAADTNRDPIPITLLSLSSLETETNVVRDQLKKAGFDVTLSIQPDYGSLLRHLYVHDESSDRQPRLRLPLHVLLHRH